MYKVTLVEGKNMMDTNSIEFRLYIVSAFLMMGMMGMLLSVMSNFQSADVLRTPMLITGGAGIVVYAIAWIIERFRFKIK